MAELVAPSRQVWPSATIVTVDRHARAGRRFVLVASGLAVLALVLRLHALDHESLWLDEGYTLLFSGLPIDRLLLVGGAHEHPPLYYLIVHALRQIHDSYLVPRVVSALAGSLAVLALYALGARLFGPWTGLAAGALLAISPFHMWFSQDGRAYELAGLFVLLSYLCVFTALEKRRRSWWVAYVLCTALALYSEYTTVLALVPQLLLVRPAALHGQLKVLLQSWTATLLLFVPWLGVLTLDVRTIAADYWIPAPTLNGVANTILEFFGFMTPCPGWPCTGGEATLPLLSGHETAVAALCAALVLAVGVAALLRRNLTVLVLTLWVVLPFAIVLLFAVRRSLFLDRIFLDATFPVYLILAAGLAKLVERYWLAVPALAVTTAVVVGSLLNVDLVYRTPSNPDWRSAARDFHAAYRPGQAVVWNPGVLRSLAAAYLPADWHATSEWPLWFHSYLDVPGWQGRYRRLVDAYVSKSRLTPKQRLLQLDARLRDLQLAHATAGKRQVWLVTQDYSGLNETRQWLSVHGYQLVMSEIYFGDARIEQWDQLPLRAFGPAVVPDRAFNGTWQRSGRIQVRGGTAVQRGHATLRTSFPVIPGAMYLVNVEYQSDPPAYPTVRLQTLDRSGNPVGSMRDRFDRTLDSFPRTEWYDLPVNGAWLSQPFGFVAPPGSTVATLRLQNLWGMTSWRHIAVYRER